MLRALAACSAALLLLASCASTQKAMPREATVVLLPDDQGKTGKIVVSGAGGEQLLSSPRQAVKVFAGAPPSRPFTLSEDDTRSQVGAALAALPSPPLQFILYFLHDSDKLTRESLVKLDDVCRRIKERAPVDISVVGHTDTVGDKPYNYQLSMKRARAVAALLEEKCASGSILDIASHGKDNPLVPTGDNVSEPRNRRVEVTVR